MARIDTTRTGSSSGSNAPVPGFLTGSTQGGSGAYGAVPMVPNPITTAGSAITGNTANLAALYGLAKPTNTFNAEEAAAQVSQNLPGYKAMLGESSGNILSHLKGVVPDDVLKQLEQTAAERGISVGGGSGSPNSEAALLRALGLTSIGLQSQGEGELTNAIQRTPTAPLFNPASFFVSPQQQQEAASAASLYAAAPNPTEAAQASQAAVAAGLGAGLRSGPTPSNPSIPAVPSSWNPNSTLSGYGGEFVVNGPNSGVDTTPSNFDWSKWVQSLSPTATGTQGADLLGGMGVPTAVNTATGAAGDYLANQDMNYLLGLTDTVSD